MTFKITFINLLKHTINDTIMFMSLPQEYTKIYVTNKWIKGVETASSTNNYILLTLRRDSTISTIVIHLFATQIHNN